MKGKCMYCMGFGGWSCNVFLQNIGTCHNLLGAGANTIHHWAPTRTPVGLHCLCLLWPPLKKPKNQQHSFWVPATAIFIFANATGEDELTSKATYAYLKNNNK